MKLSTLVAGDLIEADVHGVKFAARFEKLVPDQGIRRLAKVEPVDPKRYSWRFLGARQIVKRLETQERLEVSA